MAEITPIPSSLPDLPTVQPAAPTINTPVPPPITSTLNQTSNSTQQSTQSKAPIIFWLILALVVVMSGIWLFYFWQNNQALTQQNEALQTQNANLISQPPVIEMISTPIPVSEKTPTPAPEQNSAANKENTATVVIPTVATSLKGEPVNVPSGLNSAMGSFLNKMDGQQEIPFLDWNNQIFYFLRDNKILGYDLRGVAPNTSNLTEQVYYQARPDEEIMAYLVDGENLYYYARYSGTELAHECEFTDYVINLTGQTMETSRPIAVEANCMKGGSELKMINGRPYRIETASESNTTKQDYYDLKTLAEMNTVSRNPAPSFSATYHR